MAYEVRFYSGDYRARQIAANADDAKLYVEGHLNSFDGSKNHALALVASNASERSKAVARRFTRNVAAEFALPNAGARIVEPRERGNYSLAFTKMPAFLAEPFYIDTAAGAQWARSRYTDIADCLVAAIREQFPLGGLIAFSIGHVGKTSNPSDRGALSALGDWESDLVTPYMKRAGQLLERTPPPIVIAEEDMDGPHEAAEPPAWAIPSRDRLVAMGLTDGLRYDEPATRAETWVMIDRMYQRLLKEKAAKR